jgi:hypothetical protein
VLSESKGDSRKIHQTMFKLLGITQSMPLPESESPRMLADDFNRYFIDKIDTINILLESRNVETQMDPHIYDTCYATATLMEFQFVSEMAVRKIFLSAPCKSCELDPVPTTLLKDVVDVVNPVISHIVNTSMQTGTFTDNLKFSVIRPLLKKPTLELTYKNYRPVTNLTFLSKLIERCVLQQIHSFIKSINMTDKHQSAYKTGHSTESALVKVRSDILANISDKKVTCLVMLDLSAAFDTVHHGILLQRLHRRFNIRGIVLEWIRSYLSSRTQKVNVRCDTGQATSGELDLAQGVPQGSVLGPALFTLYTSPLMDICKNHNLNNHLYADDNQIYIAFTATPDNLQSTVDRINACVGNIRDWMNVNYLKINNDKTELMFIGTPQQLSKLEHLIDQPINIDGADIMPVKSVRNLGFYMDCNLKNTVHISKLCSSLYLTLRNIARIRDCLTRDSCRTLVQSLVLSRLDYCNALLVGTPKCHLRKLQSMQNIACRIICRLRKYDHISTYMRDLHWLKVRERITFKIAIMMYRCVHGTAPSYLIDLLKFRENPRGLRSTTHRQIQPVLMSNTQACNGAFQSCGPIVWNSLPIDLIVIVNEVDFAKKLKTHLFMKSYS